MWIAHRRADADVSRFLRLLTFLPLEEIEDVEHEHAQRECLVLVAICVCVCVCGVCVFVCVLASSCVHVQSGIICVGMCAGVYVCTDGCGSL
jgi:hypothetical protein